MMGKRIVEGLVSAKRLEGKPAFIPTGRSRGLKAYGIRYEKQLAKYAKIPIENRGVWFEFIDGNGIGYCQVDFLIGEASAPVVLELKHTWTEDGHVELEKLYLPVVSKAMGARSTGVVVVKRLTEGMKRTKVCGELGDAVWMARAGQGRVVWHWIGVGGMERPKTTVCHGFAIPRIFPL